MHLISCLFWKIYASPTCSWHTQPCCDPQSSLETFLRWPSFPNHAISRIPRQHNRHLKAKMLELDVIKRLTNVSCCKKMIARNKNDSDLKRVYTEQGESVLRAFLSEKIGQAWQGYQSLLIILWVFIYYYLWK